MGLLSWIVACAAQIEAPITGPETADEPAALVALEPTDVALRLGEAGAAQVDAWAEARPCTRRSSGQRTVLSCGDPLEKERQILEYADGEAIDRVRSFRRLSDQGAATQAYAARVTRVTATLGPPPEPAAQLAAGDAARVERVSARWEQDDLTIEVGLLRLGADAFLLSERWSLRPGAGGRPGGRGRATRASAEPKGEG